MPQALFAPGHWHRISEFQAQGIGRRNQWWTAAVRSRMDSDVFPGWPSCIAPTAKPFRLNSVHLTLLPGDAQLPKIVSTHRRETDHFKTWEISHRTPFSSLPFRGGHRKNPHKIARIGREWIECNWVYLSFSFYLPSGFHTSRKSITVLARLIFQHSGVPQPDFLKSAFGITS